VLLASCVVRPHRLARPSGARFAERRVRSRRGVERAPAAPDSKRTLWTCPKCGARLVTRILWHSCGRHTLEALLARSDPPVLELARRFVRVLQSLGDVQVLPQKTRLVCVARVRFAGDLDAELRSWLQESHDTVGMQATSWSGTRRRSS
jgi:hypothetical protein